MYVLLVRRKTDFFGFIICLSIGRGCMMHPLPFLLNASASPAPHRKEDHCEHLSLCIPTGRPHPLLQPVRYTEQLRLPATVLVKLESFNPAGSVKDRVALEMIEDAEKRASSCRRHHRGAHLRQHRHRSRGHGPGPWLPSHPHYARVHESGAPGSCWLPTVRSWC